MAWHKINLLQKKEVFSIILYSKEIPFCTKRLYQLMEAFIKEFILKIVRNVTENILNQILIVTLN